MTQTRSFADRIILDPSELTSANRNLKDVADCVVLVGQTRKILDDGTESNVIVDVELFSAEWALQFSIDNDGKGERTKEMTTEIGMTTTSGKEVSTSVSASAGFSGWGVSAEVNASIEEKSFNTMETSTLTRVTDTYTCPSESAIFVYKRRYKFCCRTWLYNAAQNAWFESNTGRIEGYFTNEIASNQELISPLALSSHGRITNDPPSGLVIPTKGWNIETAGGLSSIILGYIRAWYPWVK
ncbi:hypothetical protein N7478_004278 [Penicillium angulare]|uniref:uncharacterized protein n=1 Tax=Penicillium angulare TaxID=116970 RepID=UPI002541F840|nr:uncharacterized protein N7478_004278 [Penicillium angulare]KAJ5278906.1 hypothetical protein N7478_004278 [Penicillium angulare]